MQRMPVHGFQSSRWALQLRLRAVLCQAGGQHAPEQAPGQRDAGRRGPLPGFPVPTGHLVLRRPDPDETPLSPAEIRHAQRIGVIE